MKEKFVVGILRETNPQEQRTPLTPTDSQWLIKRGIEVEVESDSKRVFSNREYKQSGARVLKRFRKAKLLLGIKQPKLCDLYSKKMYMLFSHTAKSQAKNIPFLKSCLKRKNTLIDYEKIVDSRNRRLVFFGRFAGICGMLDGLHYLGERLAKKGIENPFLSLQPARCYQSLKQAKQAVAKVAKKINQRGLDQRISPLIIGFAGRGNVSRGAQEILDIFKPLSINSRQIAGCFNGKDRDKTIYKIVFLKKERLRSQTNKPFCSREYLRNPKEFESNMDKHLASLNMFINASYWDSRYPRLITERMVKKLARRDNFRLDFIADISCDIKGSVELTYKNTSPLNPIFTYDFEHKNVRQGCQVKGISVLAVDNLPTELPKEASSAFSRRIRNYVYKIASGASENFSPKANIPLEIRRATMLQKGKLTKRFIY